MKIGLSSCPGAASNIPGKSDNLANLAKRLADPAKRKAANSAALKLVLGKIHPQSIYLIEHAEGSLIWIKSERHECIETVV